MILLVILKKRSKNNTINCAFLILVRGSGALLISLLLEWPGAVGVGVDVSGEALVMARQNAAQLGCQDRSTFLQGHWLEALDGMELEPFDLVVCNPPYIPSNDIEGLAREVNLFDPRLALDGGADGLDPYREIIPQLRKVMTRTGMAIFEFGRGQDEAVSQLFETAGLVRAGRQKGIYKDLAGTIRCLAASPQAPSDQI